MSFKLNDKVYNALKWVAQYLLPALATFYFTLAGIWGLPYVEEVLGTITALDTFLGIILGISSKAYNKSRDGSLMVDTSDPETDKYLLKLDIPLEEVPGRKSITLNVNNSNSQK